MDGFHGNLAIMEESPGLLGNSMGGGDDGTPVYLGYIAAVVAVIFYGSNFVPLKKFETGDGMFFQLILCTAIMFVGLMVDIARGSPPFYPIVMIGGAIWAIGNICVVPIIKSIGIGLGICIWGTTNLLSGWASGRFGAFGLINPEVPNNTTLNYIGIGLAVCSATVYLFVRSDVSTLDIEVHVVPDDTKPLLSDHPVLGSDEDPLLPMDVVSPYLDPSYVKRHSYSGSIFTEDNSHILVFNSRKRQDTGLSINDQGTPPTGPISSQITMHQHGESFIDRLSPVMKRIVGSILACISGILYGVSFTPAIHVQDKVHGASQNGLDYVFSHFSGIFATSVALFVIYAAFMRNTPKVYPKAILPGLISGAMWAVATSCWFIANKVLSEPVSFPIVTTGPGIVGSLWGVVIFKEIKGCRNLFLLCCAFLLTCSCGIVSGFSKSG